MLLHVDSAGYLSIGQKSSRLFTWSNISV